MHPITLILVLFALTTTLSLFAVRLKIPYPTAMVVAGLLIGIGIYLFPHPDHFLVTLDPDVLFTLILPPLLYAAAWFTSWNAFRKQLRTITLLATGGVLFTTVGIAAVAMAFIPGFTWPVAFAFGAIVSPPDAVAAAAVTERLRIPKRIITILDGESLVNDATALVVLRFAIAAALTGAFYLPAALVEFPLVAGGGIVVGLALAWFFHQVHERIELPLIETALTLLTPYACYLMAEELHTSGVLAVVTCGLVLSRHSHHLFSAQTRLSAIAFWSFLTFMLNGLVFILIGLQLPTILRNEHVSLRMACLYGALICGAMIVLRLLWVFPGAYLPRMFAWVRKQDPYPPWQHVFLVGWVGMRGVVSLAAALALPTTLPDGSALPARDLVLFLTFASILFTLVFQSLTLPMVIKLLGIDAPAVDQCEETEARRRAYQAALDSLVGQPDNHATESLRALYTHRLDHLQNCSDTETTPDPEHALLRHTLRAQRHLLVSLRDTDQIPDELLRKLEHELDLEESSIPE